MLAFVTAEEASMETFLSASASSTYQQELREYLASLVRQACTSPDWCIVGLEGEAPIARAALWALPGQAVPTDIVLIETDWSDEELSAGVALLARVLELTAALGAGGLSHSVDSPPPAPQYQEHEEARIRLLVRSGYRLLRDGVRWRYSPSTAREAPPAHSLLFRPLSESGDDMFVDAIASTYEGTRDSWITESIQEHGTLGAARADFQDYQRLDFEPDWWELAYTESGALAGVIMAARNPSTAVIAYVGVVPEQRGRGLAVELVRRGTKRLLASDADEIRGDCDLDNIGMVKGFERAGFEQFAHRRTYHYAIT
jgi:ribosomal protein S18 acetylase RimI-like enzyme